jgi:hypothetical protein
LLRINPSNAVVCYQELERQPKTQSRYPFRDPVF